MASGVVDMAVPSGLDQDGGEDQPEHPRQGCSSRKGVTEARNPCVGPLVNLVGPDIVETKGNFLQDTSVVRGPVLLESQPGRAPEGSCSYGTIGEVLEGEYRDVVEVHHVGDAAFSLEPAVDPGTLGRVLSNHRHEGLDAVLAPSVHPVCHDGEKDVEKLRREEDNCAAEVKLIKTFVTLIKRLAG